jgi:thioredoxin reductase (NADPH)
MPQPAAPAAVDLLIVGGGPTGLFGAFYAGLRQMSVKILDSLEALGGQLVTLYPEKYIYDVAGFPRVIAKDLAKNLVEQALQYGPAVCLGEQVSALEFDEGNRIYTVRTARAAHPARAILVAAGIGSFAPKLLSLANAHDYEGHGLHYFVRDLATFRGRRILIVGGGDSAVDWANTLSDIATVTLIHRRDQFRAHEDSVRRMKEGHTRMMLFHELKAIGGDGRLQWATIYDNRNNDEHTLEIDDVVVNIGFINTLGAIRDWGLELEGSAIRVDPTMRTSRPGIFAAGDIVSYPGKLKLIATGFGEACTAVNYAKTWIDPGAKAFPGHSSEMKR